MTHPQVAILCVSRNSVYHGLPDVICYDQRRDARTFPGDLPIVAHPPCRAWSAFCRHQAKPPPGEAELGLWCCDMLRQCGGVLEQPAHSHLFQAAGLPAPGTSHEHLSSIEVWQAWWGYPMRKATWLCLSGISPDAVELPFRLHPAGADRRRQQLMSKNQRAATNKPFASWLVSLAKQATTSHHHPLTPPTPRSGVGPRKRDQPP